VILPTPTNDIQLKDTKVGGKILTDKDGKTLYYFSQKTQRARRHVRDNA
jgi:hypothetical protein